MSKCSRIVHAAAPAVALVLAPGCSDLPTVVEPVAEIPAAASQTGDAPTPSTAVAAELTRDPAAVKGGSGPIDPGVAIEDALDRVLPALEPGGATQGLEAALLLLLSQLEKKGGDSRGLESALAEVQDVVASFQAKAGPEFQPDIGAVRLAVDALTAGDREEGSPRNRSKS